MNISKALSVIAFRCLVLFAKTIDIEKVIVDKSYELLNTRSIVTAGGLLYWFVAYRLRLNLPEYNIYHLFDKETERSVVSKILKPRISDYRVGKQYFLLEGEVLNDEEFTSFVEKALLKSIQHNIGRTNLKKQNYSSKNALSALRDVNSFFSTRNGKLFLVSGTLLGFIRDGGPIPGDNDVDVGIFDDDKNSMTAMDELPKLNWVKHLHRTRNFLQIVHKNGVTTDIFIHYHREGRIWHGTDIHQWHNSPFTLSKKKFGNLEIFIPKDYDQYLMENYGNWKESALFWDYSFDTPNREFCRNRKTVLFLTERAINAITSRNPDRYSAQTALYSLCKYFDFDVCSNLGQGTYIDSITLEKQ